MSTQVFHRMRPLLFIFAGLIQIGLIGLMVWDRAQMLREGSEVMLQTRPVDPRDFLRGDYVVLAYDISRIGTGSLKDTPATSKDIYVKLAPKPETDDYDVVSVHTAPVAVGAGEALIHGRVTSGGNCGPAEAHTYCDRINVDYGIEKYFVPEGEGRNIEDGRNAGKVTVVAAVTPTDRRPSSGCCSMVRRSTTSHGSRRRRATAFAVTRSCGINAGRLRGGWKRFLLIPGPSGASCCSRRPAHRPWWQEGRYGGCIGRRSPRP